MKKLIEMKVGESICSGRGKRVDESILIHTHEISNQDFQG